MACFHRFTIGLPSIIKYSVKTFTHSLSQRSSSMLFRQFSNARAVISCRKRLNPIPVADAYLKEFDHNISFLRTGSIHTSSRHSGVMEDRDTKALTLWSSIKEVRRSPVPALTLGLSGLLPFTCAPAYMMMNQIYMADLAFAQVAYGAVILSFLGGVRWGFTLPEENPVRPDWVNLGYSVMPSLVAWGGLLLPSPLSLFTMMSGLTLAGYFDMAMFGYPAWFKGLRFLLSFVAVLSLWTTFMCGFLIADKKESQEIKEK